ncbi:DUF72 domain-containing protein [Pedobacter mucosus]|uniref:DUF72 domain-containing protein n=1 Tax=Pedobacter mucosus TaxID=2895286 RepID=UPI001EE3CD57|nr:DUF72 domain-containing protein [Pedobacter mucosus]UKT62584.1 DUF72 domain-containing protein [Pedobacter mucosus]
MLDLGKKGNLYLGTSGLILPVRNKSFYPEQFKEKSRLHYYSSLTNSIEINSSFYKIPMGNTVAKWATEVGDDFNFSFKLAKEITHSKNLIFDSQVLSKALQVIESVKEKKGCLLVQFPGSFRSHQLPQLEILVQSILNFIGRGWDIAIEFRHISWYNENVYDFLNLHKVGIVLQDKPPAITPMVELEANFIYLRFHGPNGNYRDSYSEDFLFEYAEYIKDWLDEGKNVYAYFNNTIGEAFNNLQTLRLAVGS